jgi:hypothetical protein
MAVHRPNLLVALARTLVISVLITALAFALTLLISIISLTVLSAVRHTTLDMSFAYRVAGVRVVMVVAPVMLIIVGAQQLRDYFRARSEARPLKFAR